MASKLATATARYLGQNGRLRSQAVAVADALAKGRVTFRARGPFSGYLPDLDPNLVDATQMSLLQNVLARTDTNHGEVLGLPDGYRQIDSARLPLGDGSSLPATPVGDGTEVCRIDQVARFGPTGHASPGEYTGEFSLTPMVVTGGSAAAGSGNMYRNSPVDGQWKFVAGSASMTAATRQLSATRDGRSSSKSMPDSCVAPFGAVARAANTAGNDDKQSGNIKEPCWIFTNDVDEVMVFPSSTTETLAATHAYEPLCDHISSNDLDSGGASGFKAKSVETWNGRVYFLNTSEANTRRSQRLRRTAKFTADPLTSTPGAGFYDFREFQGEGLRIETLGDVLAVYFSDGVAFMRPTGNPTSPDEPQILSTQRGLMSTHAVCAVERGAHFGIFTDGWWFIDQSGRWQQAGVVNLDGKILPKWRQTFYEGLPNDQRHRLQVYYDQPANLIYIARPTFAHNEPNEVWIYDPDSDRVFFENYNVTCFGAITPINQSGTTINALVGTIDAQTVEIDSFAPVAGFQRVRAHGDQDGFVYQHRRDITGFDSAAHLPTVQDPQWRLQLGLRSPNGMRNLITLDRVSIEYFNHGNSTPVNVSAIGPAADGSQARSVQLNSGNLEDLRYRDAWFRYTSTAPGVELSGSGEFHIRSLEIDAFADPVEPRGL